MAKNYWAQLPATQCGTFQTEADAHDRLPDLIVDPRNEGYELEVCPAFTMKWSRTKGGASASFEADGWMIARRFTAEVWEDRQRKLREKFGPSYNTGPSFWDEYQREAKASPTGVPLLTDEFATPAQPEMKSARPAA